MDTSRPPDKKGSNNAFLKMVKNMSGNMRGREKLPLPNPQWMLLIVDPDYQLTVQK